MKNWNFRGKVITLDHPLIMGILNLSPESFSGDGNGDAISRAMTLVEQGADIIDVGGCSTAPHHKKLVSEEEELERVIPIVKALKGKISVPISVDTFRPKVAKAVAELGADIINDVSGIINPEMASVVKEFNCGWVVTHTADITCDDSVSQVKNDLENMVKDAVKLGVPQANICIDPGIGFNKDNRISGQLIKNTHVLATLPYPLLVGLSRKRIIGELSGIENANDRDIPSLLANMYCVKKGADIIRVHNVDMTATGFDTIFNLERFNG